MGRCDFAGNVRRLYQFDEQGSVALATDASGSLVDARMVDAYGREWSTAMPTDPYGFDARWGYVCDREIGTY